MDEFEQKSREVARAILKRHGWKRPMSAELKEMRDVIDLPYTECKRYLVEEWQNMRVPLLEKEIKQLRELVRDTYKLCWDGLDCTECPRSFYDRCDKSDGCSWLGILHERMRELEIEVSE